MSIQGSTLRHLSKYVNVIAPPHPTPPLRDVTHHDVYAHVQVNVPWRNIMGARKYVNVIAPPHPCVT